MVRRLVTSILSSLILNVLWTEGCRRERDIEEDISKGGEGIRDFVSMMTINLLFTFSVASGYLHLLVLFNNVLTA